jgi:long-chain acyl-CoA synthetase
MIAENLFSVPEGEKMRLFGIFSKNRAEWTLTDIAANLFGFTTIPIYDTLGDENITYVFNHTQMNTVFVSEGALKSLTKCKDLVKINTIVCYDEFTEDLLAHFQSRGSLSVMQALSSFFSTIFTRSAKKNC